MSIFTKAWDWLKGVFGSVGQSADSIAIVITEQIQSALKSGVAGFLATVIDGLTKSNVGDEVLNLLKKYIPEVLAVELAIQGLPANPTEADILAFEQRVLAAFGVTDNTSKLYTTVAAQLYGRLQEALLDKKLTFAECVAIVEGTYQDYVGDQNATPDA